MTTAVSRNVEGGVGFDARRAAEAAARRAGMTLGDWLNGIIAERAAETGRTAKDIDEDERIAAVAARLARLSKEAQHGACRDRGLTGSDNRHAARPADETASAGPKPACAGSRVGRRARPPTDPERLLDRAIATVDRRPGSANPTTSVALALPSQPSAGIEGRLEQRVESEASLSAAEAPSHSEAPIESIARQREPADTKTPLNGRAEDLARIEAKLNRLSATIDRVTHPQPRRGSHGAPLARRRIADAVAEISRRQVALDQNPPAVAEPDRLGTFKADLAALATRLEEIRRDIATRDEEQFRAIGEKLEALGAGHTDVAALARIRTQTEEIRDLLAAAVAQPLPIENIEGKIAALAERLEAIATRGPSATAYAQCDSKLAEIRAALAQPLPDPLLQEIEHRIESLTQKVEEALSNSAGSEHFDELRQRLDFIHQSLAARIERPPPPLDTTAFEAMMREIVGKLNQTPAAAVAAPQLENLMSRLVDRLEAPVDTHRLEQLLNDLAEKIDLLAKPPADLPGLRALQDQIARLSRRLDDADANADVLGSLERSISDLFAGLEETRRAAIDAAETAARTAARDAMQAIALAPAPGAPPDEPENDVTRELADLRALQDAADRQTHATLTAVHETLEKVVDRLAMLEDDIIDVRAATSEPPLATEPPLFTQSPRAGSGPATARAHFPHLAPASTRRSEPPPVPEELAPLPLDDRDFLIEPGSGFSPERHASETDRRSTREPPAPPSPPPSEPPAAPPSMPSPPPTGTSQANFIAAARRSIQANAMENAPASSGPGKAAGGLSGALAEARSRAHAAATAFMDDRNKPAGQDRTQPRRGGAIARAGAFFSTRKRQLMLGLAGIVVVLCALELARIQVSPGLALTGGTGVAAPGRRAPVRTTAPAGAAPLSRGRLAPRASDEPTISGARSGKTAPANTSSSLVPGDLSPVGSIAAGAAAPSRAPVRAADDLAGLRDLAQNGNAAAEFELGLRYVEGRSLRRNLKLAAKWFEKAAKQNNAPAEYRLATLYEKGLGVKANTLTALDWYRRAAKAGNVRAMHNFAVLRAEGIDGKPDYNDAAIWFRKAAEFGVRDSQYNLAILYARGLGVPKDLLRSYIWFALAAAQGDDEAAKKRDEVGTHLDLKQLTKAKAIIAGFTPRKALASANTVTSPLGSWRVRTTAPAASAKSGFRVKPVPGARMSAL